MPTSFPARIREPHGTFRAGIVYIVLLTPLKPLEEKAYVYLHFEEAMDAKMARIPMYVSINIVPQSLRQAVIATEDRRFYSHGAIDLSASSAPPQSTSIPAKP